MGGLSVVGRPDRSMVEVRRGGGTGDDGRVYEGVVWTGGNIVYRG